MISTFKTYKYFQTSFKEPLDSGTQLMYATVVLDLDKLNKLLQTNVKDLQQHCKTVCIFLYKNLNFDRSID